MGAVEHCIVVCSRGVSPRVLAQVEQPEQALVIAADGGWLRCRELGLTPQLVVGDFDSAPRPDDTAQTKVYPSHKDETDCLLALQEGLDRGCTRFTLLGATGGRLDHTLAGLQTLAWLEARGASGVILDETTAIRLLAGPGRLELPRQAGYLSVFALDSVCTGVNLRGVEYPLHNHTLTVAYPLGISNHITTPAGVVEVAQGRLLVMTVTEEEAT